MTISCQISVHHAGQVSIPFESISLVNLTNNFNTGTNQITHFVRQKMCTQVKMKHIYAIAIYIYNIMYAMTRYWKTKHKSTQFLPYPANRTTHPPASHEGFKPNDLCPFQPTAIRHADACRTARMACCSGADQELRSVGNTHGVVMETWEQKSQGKDVFVT